MDVTSIEPVDVEKVAEENPQSRFRIHDTAILKPGVCVMCRSAGGDGRQFVDFGRTDTWYGVVYVCTFCITEAANLLGLQNNEQLKKQFNDLNDVLHEITEERGRFAEALDAARLLLRNCHCDNTDVLRSASSDDAMDVEVIEDSDGHNDHDGESGSVERSDDFPESPADESDAEPVKPKRTRRSSNSDE